MGKIKAFKRFVDDDAEKKVRDYRALMMADQNDPDIQARKLQIEKQIVTIFQIYWYDYICGTTERVQNVTEDGIPYGSEQGHGEGARSDFDLKLGTPNSELD